MRSKLEKELEVRRQLQERQEQEESDTPTTVLMKNSLLANLDLKEKKEVS